MSTSSPDQHPRRKFLAVMAGASLLKNLKPASAEAAFQLPPEAEETFLGSELYTKLRTSIKGAIPKEELETHNIFVHPTPNLDMVITRPMINDIPILGSVYNLATQKKLEIVFVEEEFLSVNSAVPERFRKTLITRVRRAYYEYGEAKLSGFTDHVDSSIVVVVTTGGIKYPTPEKSLLKPEQISPLNSEQVAKLNDPYSYIPKNEKFRTPPIRHELGHIKSDGSTHNFELEADRAMLKGVTEAARRYQQNQDLSGYIPLLTPTGIVYI